MAEEVEGTPERVGALRKRRTTLDDGRYLIYFTFEGGEPAPAPGGEGARPEPEAETVAAEERGV